MPSHYDKKVAKKAKKKKPHDPGADNPVKNPYTGAYDWAGKKKGGPHPGDVVG